MGDIFQITVDGPLNLFYKTKRYGMNLANFFVAVLHQPKWELTAEIQFRNKRSSRLCLNESCGIKPISQQFLAYIPEDIKLFQEDAAQQNGTTGRFARAVSFCLCLEISIAFQIINCSHTDGVEVAIELFHPWHQSHLLARLNTFA